MIRAVARVQPVFTRLPITGSMTHRALIAVLLIAAACGLAAPARAQQGVQAVCLDPIQQRAAVFQGQALPLGIARRSLHPADGDALLRARLCYRGNNLVYVLTLLSRNGAVTNTIVDAREGRVIGPR